MLFGTHIVLHKLDNTEYDYFTKFFEVRKWI